MTRDASDGDPLQRAYSAEEFRRIGHRFIDLLADYWQTSLDRRSPGAIPWSPPEEMLAWWEQRLAEGMSPQEFAEALIARSVRISDPRFMGHQICAPTPISILTGMIVDCLNNGSGVYEMGMSGTAMEKLVVARLASILGLPTTADGFLTSGGTLANLTALLVGRSARGREIWTQGQREQFAVLVSEQAHYCVDRAVRIMGWGDDGVITVPVDDQYRMRVDLLESLYRQALDRGVQPVAVVGSACTTSTGSFDPLEAIGSFCRRRDLWFHVDAAHGGALGFSRRHRHRLQGIEMADSLVLDFHKMLMTPVITSAVLFRRWQDSYRAFAVEADYLFGKASPQDQFDRFNLARRTFECTKTMMSAKVFANLAIHGPDLAEANVDRLMERAQEFAAIIESHTEFELALRPQCNIVCFRHRQGSEPERSQRNRRIRQALIQQGQHYIVQTTLRGETWLRSTLSNPFTTRTEMDALLASLSALARSDDA
ncbi:MAG: aspartate aminotransferase family protein [Planctomycetota bacterium]|nr:MAG: aspartate aminotransferase family protein [Planctomycetota bacterium]